MTRFIPKQFAENSTTSVVFGSFQEQGGNVGDGTISSDPATLQGGTAWPLGWSAATDNFFKIPRGEEMEGLERVLSAAIIQQFKDGLTFWQPEMPVTQYQTIVQYQTGSDLPKLYVNITGTSTSTPPDSDTTNWYMFLDTGSPLANVSLTNSPYTTNRILEIPQDIKLELNNGTLTLKAGSKVYVPNGFEADGTTPKFDVVTIENDNSTTNTQSYNYKYIMLYNIDTTEFYSWYEGVFFSGPTQPVGHPACIWYDTNNNIIKLTTDSFSTWTKVCFPLGIIQQSSSGVTTAIDQIFNGFGYIGSTVFALPGVKVQTPNGKNADGTYKSVIRTIDSVRTYDAGAWGTRNLNVQIIGSIVTPYFEGQAVERFTYNKKFSSDTTTYSYDENTGVWWYSSNQSSWEETLNNIVGTCRVENGKITSFEPYTVDSVLNSNLSNLSAAGEAHFANPSLSNLSANGLTKIFKTGMMIPWGGTSSNKPDGWLVCDGSAVSRTTYADLFAIIGTAYGAGDGSTTFNLPNASNVYLMKTNTTPSVGVKGTGKSLGLRTTSNAFGLCQGGSGGIAYTNAYNVNAGTSVYIANIIPSSTAIGVSTDASTSGMNTNTGSMPAITALLILKY